MTVIKLDAIDSTNDYLKQLSKENILDNYTVVMANEQSNGKGQLGAKWNSEPGKNLLMSILVKDIDLQESSVFDFNVAVTLSLITLLSEMGIPNLNIKWPNDIMADGKKVAGILIENVIKSDGSITSIIGIGLNVNQTSFFDLPNAISLYNLTNKEFNNLEDLAKLLSGSVEKYILNKKNQMDAFWEKYNEYLFQRNIPTQFEDKKGNRFIGIIKFVTRDGKLALEQNNQKMYYYEVKEIKMIF